MFSSCLYIYLYLPILYSKQSCKLKLLHIDVFIVLVLLNCSQLLFDFEICFHFCIYHLYVCGQHALLYFTLNFCCSVKKDEVMGIAFSKNPYDSNTPLKMGDTKVQSNSMFPPIKSLPLDLSDTTAWSLWHCSNYILWLLNKLTTEFWTVIKFSLLLLGCKTIYQVYACIVTICKLHKSF